MTTLNIFLCLATLLALVKYYLAAALLSKRNTELETLRTSFTSLSAECKELAALNKMVIDKWHTTAKEGLATTKINNQLLLLVKETQNKS